MNDLRILVPTDFSELSIKAFPHAISLCRLLGGNISVVHAYMLATELDGFYYMGEAVPETDGKTVETDLKIKLAELAQAEIPEEFRGHLMVQSGNAAHVISDTASHFDLVIITTHGHTGFTRLVMGSVCEKVLRTCHTPLLVVGSESRFMPLRRILLTTDFSDHSLYAFEPAASLAEATGAAIDLVHIVSFEQFHTLAKAQLDREDLNHRLELTARKFLGDLSEQVQLEVIFTENSVHEEIVRLTRSRPYNLVVMATLGRTGLQYLMLGSTASGVVRNVKTAVLSINPRKKS